MDDATGSVNADGRFRGSVLLDWGTVDDRGAVDSICATRAAAVRLRIVSADVRVAKEARLPRMLGEDEGYSISFGLSCDQDRTDVRSDTEPRTLDRGRICSYPCTPIPVVTRSLAEIDYRVRSTPFSLHCKM